MFIILKYAYLYKLTFALSTEEKQIENSEFNTYKPKIDNMA